MSRLILASTSKTRVGLMANAGLTFEAIGADVDERAVETPLAEAGFEPSDIALVLAEAKARDVAVRHPDAIVVGADQTLGLEHERFHKAADFEAARRQLLKLRGRTHELHSGVVVVKGEDVLFRHVSTARLTMRDFTPEFLGHYLARVGDKALGSVGGYQLEGPGLQLFETVEGDYFTILGLPMLPLLAFLREAGVCER